MLRLRKRAEKHREASNLRSSHTLQSRQRRFAVGYLLAALVLLTLFHYLGPESPSLELTYSEFKTLLRTGWVEEVTVDPDALRGKVRTGDLKTVMAEERIHALRWDKDLPRGFIAIRIEDSGLLAELDAAKLVVHKISIIPRGIGALGYTIQRPTEDRYLMSAEELQNKMTVLLGGRAAEQVVLGHLSTGAADDLAKATDIARSMVMRFGMHPVLGLASYEAERPAFLQAEFQSFAPRRFSEETAREIDCAVRELLRAALDRGVAILSSRRAALERTAAVLLERETLTGEELRVLLNETADASKMPRLQQSSSGAAPSNGQLDAELEQTFPASDPLPWTHRVD